MPKDTDIERAIGYTFSNRELLTLALTHGSATEEPTRDNERLEFLGDAVVGLVIAQYLYLEPEEHTEGVMTRVRSEVVSAESLAECAQAIGLDKVAIFGKSLQGASLSQAVLANLFESLVAAVYLDGGIEPARELIIRFLELRIEKAMERSVDYKSAFQIRAQALKLGLPSYRIVSVKGPDHEKRFGICVRLGEKTFPTGFGRNKKSAEQQAAFAALTELGFLEPEP